MKWVKASDRLPKKAGVFFCRNIVSGSKFISRFKEKIGKQSIFHRHPESFEWLDEVTGCPNCGWNEKANIIHELKN
jgi:hypothetical protein